MLSNPIEIEFLVGLYLAAVNFGILLDSLFTPVPAGTARAYPRAVLFTFLIGIVLCVLAYLRISLIH
jgi:hypothetical protein